MSSDIKKPLDELDYAILIELQQDARKPYAEIARSLGVTLGTIRNRVSKMVADNIVRFWGRINPHRVGFQTPANIHICVQPSHLIEEVAVQLAAYPEVSYVALVAGDFDLEIDVWCRDHEHLSGLITDRIQKINGVATVKTALILRVHKIANPDLQLLNPHAE